MVRLLLAVVRILTFANALEERNGGLGGRPGASRPLRRERAGQTAEQIGFGTSGGEGEAHAAGGLDDAGGDLDQPQSQCRELGPRQGACRGDSVADGEHQPIGGGVQDEAHLVGVGERHDVRSKASCDLCSLIRFSA